MGSRGKPPEAVSTKTSHLAEIQFCSAWLKMEAPLLILTLALVSIPIIAAVLLLFPVARKRKPMVFGSGGRRSKVLELEMKSMLDARLRQFYSRMIDLKGDDDEVIFLDALASLDFTLV